MGTYCWPAASTGCLDYSRRPSPGSPPLTVRTLVEYSSSLKPSSFGNGEEEGASSLCRSLPEQRLPVRLLWCGATHPSSVAKCLWPHAPHTIPFLATRPVCLMRLD